MYLGPSILRQLDFEWLRRFEQQPVTFHGRHRLHPSGHG